MKPGRGLRRGEAQTILIISWSLMVNQFSELGIRAAKELEFQWLNCKLNASLLY
jgi:hypothetical protein